MADIIKYCEWYKNTNINSIPDLLKKDNVPIRESDLLKSLCLDHIGQELLTNLFDLKKACEYFIDNGTESTNVYRTRLEKIEKRIQEQ